MKSVFRLLPFLFLLGLSAIFPACGLKPAAQISARPRSIFLISKYLPTLPVNTQMTSAMAE